MDETTWQRALEQSPTNTIFQTRPWLETWWSHFGGKLDPFPLTLVAGGETIGWAPMIRRYTRAGRRELAFLGDGNADYMDIIHQGASTGAAQSLLAQLAERRSEWDEATLNNIPWASDTWRRLLDLAPAYGMSALCRVTQVCPSLVVRGREADAAAISNKYSLRRPCNRMKRAGSLRVFTLSDEERVATMLPDFFEQHVARWAADGRRSPFLDDAVRDYYVALWRALAPYGWARFSVVEFNGRAVAYHFGFDYGGRLLWYKPSFDPAYAQYSPGLVLIKHLLDYVLETGRDELDFSIGSEAFKSRFANVERCNLQIRLFHHKRRYFMARLGHDTRSLLKHTLQRT